MTAKHKNKRSLISRTISFLKETYILKTNNYDKLKPIFIVGCGHSGTTIMLRILGNHKDLFSINRETKAFQGNYPKMSEVHEWNIETKNKNKLRWVEKTPKHIRNIGRLLKIFPQAKIIVMQRDGRDVTVSIRQRSGNSEEALKRWVKDNNYSLNYLADSRVIAVKLEEFTDNPEDSLKKICDHLEINYSKELLDYNKKKFTYDNNDPEKTDNRSGDDHIKNRVWQVNQPLFKDTSKWKSLATDDELEMFETNEMFRTVMKSLNYI